MRRNDVRSSTFRQVSLAAREVCTIHNHARLFSIVCADYLHIIHFEAPVSLKVAMTVTATTRTDFSTSLFFILFQNFFYSLILPAAIKALRQKCVRRLGKSSTGFLSDSV